jgi:hypothetical protein
MKRKLAVAAVALALAVGLLAGTRAAEMLTIDWWSADGGGNRSGSGAYVVEGTIGQMDAGALSGGSFTLAGGYWAAAIPRSTYLPIVRK